MCCSFRLSVDVRSDGVFFDAVTVSKYCTGRRNSRQRFAVPTRLTSRTDDRAHHASSVAYLVKSLSPCNICTTVMLSELRNPETSCIPYFFDAGWQLRHLCHFTSQTS